MADRCVGGIKATRIRIVRLDACGKPVVGASSVLTSSGFVSVSAAADNEDGEEFLQKNAAGEFCINEKDKTRLKRYNLTISFCNIDANAVEMTTGQRLLLDPDTSDVIGMAIGENPNEDQSFSLELWQKIAGAPCDATGDPEWLYWAFPYVTNGSLGDLTFENGPFLFDITADTKGISGDSVWGTDNRGPFCVLPEDAGLLAGEHLAEIITAEQPPTAVCGPVAYVAQVCA